MYTIVIHAAGISIPGFFTVITATIFRTRFCSLITITFAITTARLTISTAFKVTKCYLYTTSIRNNNTRQTRSITIKFQFYHCTTAINSRAIQWKSKNCRSTGRYHKASSLCITTSSTKYWSTIKVKLESSNRCISVIQNRSSTCYMNTISIHSASITIPCTTTTIIRICFCTSAFTTYIFFCRTVTYTSTVINTTRTIAYFFIKISKWYFLTTSIRNNNTR